MIDVLGPIIGEQAARIVILAAILLLIAALALVVVGLAFRIFRGRTFGFRGSRSRAPRLSVPDVMPVDSRRKLVLVRRDTVEHLLLVGGATDVVIETAARARHSTCSPSRTRSPRTSSRHLEPSRRPRAPALPGTWGDTFNSLPAVGVETDTLPASTAPFPTVALRPAAARIQRQRADSHPALHSGRHRAVRQLFGAPPTVSRRPAIPRTVVNRLAATCP